MMLTLKAWKLEVMLDQERRKLEELFRPTDPTSLDGHLMVMIHVQSLDGHDNLMGY